MRFLKQFRHDSTTDKAPNLKIQNSNGKGGRKQHDLAGRGHARNDASDGRLKVDAEKLIGLQADHKDTSNEDGKMMREGGQGADCMQGV
jgi:hypothetical protein